MKRVLFALLITVLSVPALGQTPDAKSAFEKAEAQLAQKQRKGQQEARRLSIENSKAESLADFSNSNRIDLTSVQWGKENDITGEYICDRCTIKIFEQIGHFFKSTGEP